MGKEPRDYGNDRQRDSDNNDRSNNRGDVRPNRDGANNITDWDRPPRPSKDNDDKKR
jgi:hypothetical protein